MAYANSKAQAGFWNLGHMRQLRGGESARALYSAKAPSLLLRVDQTRIQFYASKLVQTSILVPYTYTRNRRTSKEMLHVATIILFAVVIKFCSCEATETEYFVRPTNSPATATCPGQPCFTFNYYNNYSRIYYRSNSTFTFLSGVHYVDKPVLFKAVRNISLKSYVHDQQIEVNLVSNFMTREKLSSILYPVIKFEGVDGIFIQGVMMISAVPGSPAFVLNNTKHVNLELNSFTCSGLESIGLLLQNAHSVKMNFIHIVNCSHGVIINNSAYMTISNIITEHNNMSGIMMMSTFHTVITNIVSRNNTGSGMIVNSSHNTTIQNANCSRNSIDGVLVLHSTDTSLKNVTAEFNRVCGLYINDCNFTSITLSTLSYNNEDGMHLEGLWYINITNTITNYNYDSGIFLNFSRNVSISSLFSSYNFNGIVAYHVFNVSMSYSEMTYNSGHSPHRLGSGLMVLYYYSLHISNCAMSNSDNYGMTISEGENLLVENIFVKQCNYSGIFLSQNINNFMKNVTVLNSYMNIVLYLSVENYISGVVVTSTEASRGLTMYTANNTFVEGMKFLPYTGSKEAVMDIKNVITESVILTNCTNATMAINLYALQQGVSIYNSSDLTIRDSSFSHMKPLTFSSDPSSSSSIILLYYSSLTISNCVFTINAISAIKSFSSNLTLSGSTNFTNNTAQSGTAFILSKDSVIRLSSSSHTIFTNNHATNTGGVFYIVTNLHYNVDYITTSATVVIDETTCFLQTDEDQSEPALIFQNNTAGYAGDLIYGGQIANGWDGEQNCLPRFKNISRILPPFNKLSLISSDPSRVCVCDEASGLPDCLNVLDSQNVLIYPGQAIQISAVVTGQNFGTAAGSVHAQFLKQSPTHTLPQLQSWQYTQGVTQHQCNSLPFTIFPSEKDISNEVLILTSHDEKVFNIPSRERVNQTINLWKSSAYVKSKVDNTVFTKELFEYPVYINISILPCPLGFSLTNTLPYICECNDLLNTLPGVECSIQHEVIIRSGSVWIGMTSVNNSQTIAVSEYCPQGYCRMSTSNSSLNDSNTQCDFNRAGTLCGGCEPGLSLTLGSYHCETCSNVYLVLLIPFCLAGIALVLFIRTLDMTVAQGTINALILYANIIQASKTFFLSDTTTPLTVFISWLNLDVGVKTCFFSGMTAYSNTWLQFVFPLYIWTILGTIIVVAKYSDRAAKLMGNNSVPVLATLFLLSYAKLLRAIIAALSYRIIYSEHGSKAVWASDGNLDYLGYKHAPMFAVAVVALLFLWLPYTLLLLLGQWLQKCSHKRVTKLLMQLKPFLDAHYAPFKGHHRYWFGALLLVRAIILLISAMSPADNIGATVYSISVSSILLTYVGLMVYRSVPVLMFESSFFVNLCLVTQTKILSKLYGGKEDIAVNFLIGVAFVQFLGFVLYKLFTRQREKVKKCMGRRMSLSEEDWENWEQAALLREEAESDSEDGEMSPTEDIMSSVTYGI